VQVSQVAVLRVPSIRRSLQSGILKLCQPIQLVLEVHLSEILDLQDHVTTGTHLAYFIIMLQYKSPPCNMVEIYLSKTGQLAFANACMYRDY